MDNHMQIDEISRVFGISVESIRSYAERFALFVPVVRIGAERHYPPEGVQLLREIAEAVETGASFEEIENALQVHVPLMVVATRESSLDDPAPSQPADEVLRSLFDQQREAIAGLATAVERLATADQFHGLRAETASLAAALSMRDTQFQHANSLIVSEMHAALGELRQELTRLRTELGGTLPIGGSPGETATVAAPQPDPTPEHLPSDAPAAPARRTGGRTPRRMGQPIRLNGLAQH